MRQEPSVSSRLLCWLGFHDLKVIRKRGVVRPSEVSPLQEAGMEVELCVC